MTKTDKNILTAYLDDALERRLCPICYLGNEIEYRYFDMLLYERVNDPTTREELKQSHGFCLYHTYRLLEVGAYGVHAQVCIIYKDLVQAVAQEVSSLDEGQPAALRLEGPCPVCQTVAQTHQTYVDLLAKRLSKEATRNRYGRSAGLCMRHFLAVFDRADRPTRAFLRQNQLERLNALNAEVGEFIRKSVVKDEPFGKERDAWIRVLRMYAGVLKKE